MLMLGCKGLKARTRKPLKIFVMFTLYILQALR